MAVVFWICQIAFLAAKKLDSYHLESICVTVTYACAFLARNLLCRLPVVWIYSIKQIIYR